MDMEHLHNFEKFNSINENTKNKMVDNGQTHLMTVSEYKDKVTPILKEYNKFIKKNKQYLKPIGFAGLENETYPSFIKNEIERLTKSGFERIATEEYVTERWLEHGRTTDEIPQEVYNQYLEFINKLRVFFGDQLSKVGSDELNKNKRSVRRAIDNDYYIDAMLDGIITPKRVSEILDSVGLKMSKRLSNMKYKVEHEGYTRSVSDKVAERDIKFAEKIKSILNEEDVVKQLKDRKRSNIISLCDEFDSDGNNDIYRFSNTIRKGNPAAHNILNILYTKDEKDYSLNVPLHRVENFNELVERMCIEYVNSVTSRFIHRANDKLAVINKKLGLPDVKIGHFTVKDDIEGDVDLVWDNGYELKLKAKIILAGGTYQVVLHERYLIHFFKDGKKDRNRTN